eukprot:GFYU01000839.1.p1 GENE.GFYU01000839.1~~GFYU01000839.1.p1  ORF type:complete len:864 (+),score=304.89 GFYU01000839.1:232-2823(+)
MSDVEGEDQPQYEEIQLAITAADPRTLPLLLQSPEDDVLIPACREIVNYCDNGDAAMRALHKLQVLPKLLTLLENASEDVKVAAAEAVVKLSDEPSVRKRARALGGMRLFIAYLVSENVDLQAQSIYGICKFSQDDDAFVMFRNLGGNEPLMKLLPPAPENDEGPQADTTNDFETELLTRITESVANFVADFQNKVDVRKLGGVGRLLAMIDSEDFTSDIQGFAALAIARCLEEVSCQTHTLNREGALQILLNWVTGEQKDKITVGRVATGIANLTFNLQCRKALLALQCLEPLVQRLSDEEEGLGEDGEPDPVAESRASCALALANLAKDCNVRAQLRQGGEALPALIEMAKNMGDTSGGGDDENGMTMVLNQQVQNSICCLAAMAFACSENCPLDLANKIEIVSLGGLEPLVPVLQGASAYPETLADAALVIARTAVPTENREAIRALDVYNSFPKHLEADHIRLIQSIASAIAYACYDDETRANIISAGNIEPLVKLLEKVKESGFQRNACLALANACLNSEARTEVHSLGAIKILLEILFDSNNVDVQRNVLLAITVCSRSADIAEDICREGALESIYAESISPSSKVAGYANQAVDKIIKQFPPAKFWLRGVLEYTDVTSDGFYDLSRFFHFKSMEHIAAIDVRQTINAILASNQENDENLRKYVSEVAEIMKDYERTDLRGRVTALAEYVSSCLGGACTFEEYDRFDYDGDVYSSKLEANSNVISIGALKRGVSQHRAFLFKVLADKEGIPCKLIRSKCKRGALSLHTWNCVPLGTDDHVVDLMHEPGSVYSIESEEGRKYMRVGKWMFATLAINQQEQNDVPPPGAMSKAPVFEMESTTVAQPLATAFSAVPPAEG